jgi:hypothetical protein
MDNQVILLNTAGTTEASFHISGILPVCEDKLKIVDSGEAIEPVVA